MIDTPIRLIRFCRTWSANRGTEQARRKEKRWFRVREWWDLPRTGSRGIGRVGPSGVGSYVPGIRRDRAPAEAAGSKKAKPAIGLPSVGKGPQTRCIAFGNPIRPWAVGQRVRP